MTGLFGNQANIRKMQAEMDATFRKSAAIGKQLDFGDDINVLRATLAQKGFQAFSKRAAKIIQKWIDLKGADVPYQLYRRIGDLVFEDGRHDLAEMFYDRSLAIAPNIATTHVQKAKCRILAGDFFGAKKILKRAFDIEPDMYTAALHAEIKYFTGDRREEIKAIIAPFVEESLAVRRLHFPQAMVLALNVLCNGNRRDQGDIMRSYRDNNNFTNPGLSAVNIADTIRQLQKSEALREHAKSAYRRSRAPSQERVVGLERRITNAYKTMHNSYERLASSRAISNDAINATGTRGYRPRSA
ncbi:MAG: tetratricopeptide repeat protein [Pseudomonadota bacterium]